MTAIKRLRQVIDARLTSNPLDVMTQNMSRDSDIIKNQLDEKNELIILLTSICMGDGNDKFTTKQAQLLTEVGFTVRHPYFSSDEFVKLGWVSEYPTEGTEWDRFWNDRLDFPSTWSIVK